MPGDLVETAVIPEGWAESHHRVYLPPLLKQQNLK
jgi:hypothetical protein